MERMVGPLGKRGVDFHPSISDEAKQLSVAWRRLSTVFLVPTLPFTQSDPGPITVTL